MSPKVRIAGPADADAITRVRAASWRAGYRDLIPAAVLEAMPDSASDALRARLTRPPARCSWYVAQDRGSVIGFVNLGPYRLDQDATCLEPARGGEVRAIYVDPDHWGRGIGRRLLSAAVARLREDGLTPVWLWALRDNARADRFYTRAGFFRDGTWTWFSCADGTRLMQVRYVLG